MEDNRPPLRGWTLPERVREEGLFDPVEKSLSEGDMLLIRFGHHDEKSDKRHTDPDTTCPEHLWRYCEAALRGGGRRFFIAPDGYDDKTHLNAQGARIIAAPVAGELRKIPECAKNLKET